MQVKRKWMAPIVIAVVLELWGIYMVGRWIGGWATFVLVLLAAFLGTRLIRSEGKRVLAQAQRQMQAGEPPGHTLLDGLCVLAGGILLIVPGFLSDIVGLTMIIPATRPLYRLFLYRWLERLYRGGRLTFRGGPYGS
ncbi:FxsA family protein [Cohnella suwonensis]|uniref:FxsA family protein n=1 Tax=Cohnella suwonensis TaxID=696072 RepID=A0ABW0LSK1_9BACL